MNDRLDTILGILRANELPIAWRSVIGPTDRAERLWRRLEGLMKNDARLEEMVENCSQVARLDAASKIAQRLLEIGAV